MTATDDGALFRACRARVQTLLDARADIDELERMIEALPLPTEEQCALWLWAWPRARAFCGTDTPEIEGKRQVVIDRLIALG